MESARSPRALADVVVVGGGIIGLSIAWTVVRSGRSVRLIDPAPAQGATFAAAGMLAPVSEYQRQEEDLLPLMLASAARYPDFLRELSPHDEATGYVRNETLWVGVDQGDRQMLADMYAGHRRAALAIEPMTTREARAREPLLGPRVTSAYRVRGDHQVDPRILAARLLDELEGAGRRAGDVAVIRERAVALLRGDPSNTDSGVVGVVLADGTTITAGEVVLANGLGAKVIEGFSEPLDLPVRPVFGDILRLRVPDRLRPLLRTTVRGAVHGESVYLVPRADGTLVIGATQREDGGDGVSAGGVHSLLRDAQQVLPAVGELHLIEATARARPATPDNAPLLGRVRRGDGGTLAGLVVATGFFRHGVLLAPIAADICLGLIEGRSDERWDAFRPDRFTRKHVADRAAERTHR
ncbi:glycine oxidase ThiO [Microbacterium allomyrinae]|uniref:glycine oxidase n=1 Tax=Microbacterium allomyrinae TaxID=2830666 RepID=A0A9X1LVB5_9MICO|nr:glycine oxidase ThiO [Microbacterium allomyrinae]MCC2032827.1 glycine oxidase ThiO [Microbacterium allomyrinae]